MDLYIVAANGKVRTPQEMEVHRLNSPNDYLQWSTEMETLLRARGLWYVVQSGVESPPKRFYDDMILQIFAGSIISPSLIADFTQASLAWQFLKANSNHTQCFALRSGTGTCCLMLVANFKVSAENGCVYCSAILEGVDRMNPEWNDGSQPRFALHIGQVRCKLSQHTVKISLDRSPWSTTNLNLDHLPLHELSHRPEAFLHSLSMVRKIVLKQLRSCEKFHDLCRPPDPKFVPKRLLHMGLDGSKPRLVELGSCDTQLKIEYAAFSYFWGEQQGTISTTLSNLEQHFREVDLEQIPQTIYDGIVVCRALSIPYFWVDAFCIIQDSPSEQDWYEQSGEMFHIYSNSTLVLSADVAPSASSGFLDWPRETRCVCKNGSMCPEGKDDLVRLTVRKSAECVSIPTAGDAWSAIAKSALWTRGWALQESILPNRVLHFTSRGLIWECNERCSQDGNTLGLSLSMLFSRALRIAKILRLNPELAAKQVSGRKTAASSEGNNYDDEQPLLHIDRLMRENTTDNLHHAWRGIVMEYSRRKLTEQADKLSALSGLAQLILYCLQQSSSRYLAGLWLDDLARGILWWVTNPVQSRRPAKFRAPTWSWVSVDGAVDYFREDYQFAFESAFELRAARCFSTDMDPTGRVTDGFIDLQGYLVAVNLITHTTFNGSKATQYTGINGCAKHAHTGQYSWVTSVERPGKRYEILCDERMPDILPQGTKTFYCLEIGSHRDPRTGGARHWWLMLEACPHRDQIYKRIGVGYFHKKEPSLGLFDWAVPSSVRIV